MTTESITSKETTDASVIRGAKNMESVHASGTYEIVCHDSSGNLLWKDEIQNLVTTVGKNDLLDKYLAGSSYTAAWYVGIISSVSYSAISANDTASSHAGWREAAADPLLPPNYDEATRPAATFASASGGSKSTSAASTFTIASSGTVKGAFLISNSTKDGTSGILYSAGLFTGGDKSVADGDVINITYTASA